MGSPADVLADYGQKKRNPDYESSKEKIEVSIQYKKECFNRAKKIVEHLLEREIPENFILQNLHNISQSDYQDVVEERAIVKMCGYPVCRNDLGPMPSKRFHISTSSNRVYDITERKKYCSNWCYKASLYLQEQVSASPVWFRDYETRPTFSLLIPNSSGLVGQEITMRLEKLNLSENKKVQHQPPTVSSFAFSSLEEYHNDGIFSYDNLEIKESFYEEQNEPVRKEETPAPKAKQEAPKYPTTCGRANGGIVDLSEYEIPRDPPKVEVKRVEIEKIKATVANQNKPKVPVKPKLPKPEIKQEKKKIEVKKPTVHKENVAKIQEKSTSEMSKTKSVPPQRALISKPAPIVQRTPSNPESAKFDPVKTVDVVREWFSIATLFHVLGTEEAHRRLRGKLDSLVAESKTPEWKPTIEKEILQLCKEMNETGKGANQQPDADSAVCTELDLKVAAFYQGKTSYNPEQVIGPGPNPIMPTVDRYEQRQARFKIVLARLDKVVPELADILRLNKENLTLRLQQLADTFDFAAHNVMMKPAEWNLMGLIMVKLLCETHEDLRKSLSTKKSTKILMAMLVSMELKRDFLNVLVEDLCDIDRIVGKKVTT